MLNNKHPQQKTIEPFIFTISCSLIFLFIIIGLVYTKQLGIIFRHLQDLLSTYAGWAYILSINFFLLFAIYLIFSPVSKIRLGGPDAKPDFSTKSWISMLFSAGMGIGLVFWSIAEPVLHYTHPPFNFIVQPQQAAKFSMYITFLHWGLHGWGIYTVVALTLAFFKYNKGLPLTFSSVLFPVIGKRIYGPIGKLVDIIVIIATLFGLSTSLGFGAQQINAGLSFLFPIPYSTSIQIILIILITLFATISVITGLKKGIKYLSNLNILLALFLMLFLFLVGPSNFILNSLIQNIGGYFNQFIFLSTWTEAYQTTNWQNQWTIYYWGWWLCWGPFVGIFIARISKGRTIREFIICVLFIPTFLTFCWLSVFGGTALHEILINKAGITSAVQQNIATALFVLLKHYPFAFISSLLSLFIIILFFITSSDSGSLVVDTLASGGHPNPPIKQKIFWASMEGMIAIILLKIGGLKVLKAGVILTGFPLIFILIIMCLGLNKTLKKTYYRNYQTS